MGILCGLEGVAEKEIECTFDKQFFRSVTGGLKILSDYKAAISAGDNGSITIWIDDIGKYRGSFHRNLITLNSVETSTKKGLREWLSKWLPKQQNA